MGVLSVLSFFKVHFCISLYRFKVKHVSFSFLPLSCLSTLIVLLLNDTQLFLLIRLNKVKTMFKK